MKEAPFSQAVTALVQNGCDLNLRQIAILMRAVEHPDLSVVDHAAALALSKPAVTRGLDRLQQAQLVVRRPAEDRRKVRIQATDAGKALVTRARMAYAA